VSNTNTRFVLDINRIVKVQKIKRQIPNEPQAEPIAPGRGIGEKSNKANSPSIASPLKEIGHLREYYEPELITSSDGLFVMERQVIKKLVFEDANGDNVVVIFDKIL